MILGFALHLAAQPRIEKSENFEEPLSEGWTRLMLLKNGNTFYFHYGGKKGIEVIVFDKNKKKVASQRIKSTNWDVKKKKRVEICGAYEINNEPVIFLQYLDGGERELYRLRIDPTNGGLIKEESLGASSKRNSTYMYHTVITSPSIFVEKDPESDNYAVVYLDGSERKHDNRIRVMHYDYNHNLINQGTYYSPVADFKYLNFISAAVDGSKRVYVAIYGAKTDKGAEGHVFIARLTAGDTTFLNKTLDFTEEFMKTNSDMVYDHANNRLVMLTNTLAEEKSSSKSYVSFISYIDPEDLSLKGVNVVTTEKINQYASHVLSKELNYHGLPQKLVLNKDNSITVLQEEMSFREIYSAKSGATMAEFTTLGNIGITELGSDGTEKSGYTMMKKQLYVGRLNPLYMAGRSKGIWLNSHFARNNVDDNLFMSYEYIHTDNGNYVLFNDDPKNDKRGEDEIKRKTTANTDYMNTICYTLKDGVATKSYLFGEPDGKRNTRACYIEASEYNKNTNTYTTVVSEQHGRKYDSKIAWIHFD